MTKSLQQKACATTIVHFLQADHLSALIIYAFHTLRSVGTLFNRYNQGNHSMVLQNYHGEHNKLTLSL